MNSDIKLFKFKIKKYYKMLIFLLIMLYLIILPLCIYNSLNQIISYSQPENVCFSWMQRCVFLVFVLYLTVFNKEYVEKKYHDIIYSISNEVKLKYFLLSFIIFHIIMIPFYICVCFFISSMPKWLFVFFFQSLFILMLYYFISMFIKNTVFTTAIMIFYIFIFTMFYVDRCLGNIFLLENTLNSGLFDSNIYFLGVTCHCIILLIFGLFFEKFKLK